MRRKKKDVLGSSQLNKRINAKELAIPEEKGLKKHVKKVKQVKWLLPGWAGYEYYKVHKNKGHSKSQSVMYGAKAEAIRLAAFASVPVPGSYELTTVGLASLKKKIERREVEKLTLKSLKDATPMRGLKANKKDLIEGPKKKF